MAGFQLGSGIGLMLTPILMSKSGLFGPFVIFGLSGFLWLLVWLSAVSKTPEQNPQISKNELQYILKNRQKVREAPKTGSVIPPFGRLLSKLPTWSIILANAMHSWVMNDRFPFPCWLTLHILTLKKSYNNFYIC